MSTNTVFVLLIFALQLARTTQQAAEITINPRRATTRDKVEFQCRVDSGGAGAVYFVLMRGQSTFAKEVARLEVTCSNGIVKRSTVSPVFGGTIKSDACTSITVTDVPANRDFADIYRCDIQKINADFSQEMVHTESIDLVIGEPTPPVSHFFITNLQTGVNLPASGGQVPAGTNVSISCRTDLADPVPEFTISVDGVPRPPVRPAVGSESRAVVYALVPRSPSVVYRCSVYNTFGNTQTAEATVSVLYEPEHSEFSIPKETVLQTTDEILICSVANNPPKRLAITDIDTKLLQLNYPRYVEANGYSKVFVKLSEEAKARSAKELAFACGISSGVSDPLKAIVKLVAPSSAMMTIGIVIAVVVAVVVIIAVVAVALKKRSAANKDSNGDNTRYGKVNQNDADVNFPTYEANPAGKKPITVNPA